MAAGDIRLLPELDEESSTSMISTGGNVHVLKPVSVTSGQKSIIIVQ